MDDEEDKKQKGDVDWRQAVTTVGLALSIPFMIGLPAYLGWLADNRFDTYPLWFLVGLLLGLISTALDIYKLLKRFGQFK
jgi:F0F1-type ATP synthase assembly protein I